MLDNSKHAPFGSVDKFCECVTVGELYPYPTSVLLLTHLLSGGVIAAKIV